MSNTRKPITGLDELCEQLFSPPPLDDSGPRFDTPPRRREPAVDWLLVCCWAFLLFGLFLPWARGVQVLVSDFYAWCREVI